MENADIDAIIEKRDAEAYLEWYNSLSDFEQSFLSGCPLCLLPWCEGHTFRVVEVKDEECPAG